MTKTKKMPKAFAALLVVLLLVGLLPITIFAADGDISAPVVRGVTLSEAPVASIAAARAATIEVALTPEQLAATTAVTLTEEGNTTTAVIMRVAGGADSAVADAGDITTVATNVALVPGDIIWIKNAAGTQFYRILINQASSGTIPGTSTTKNPIYNVVVPTDTDFVINPLQLGTVTGDSQITTTDYRVTNKSDAPVMVSFDITATLETGVTLVADTADLDQTSLTNVDKEVYLAVLGADSFADNTVPTHGNPDLGTYVYDATDANLLVPFDTTDKDAEFAFLLGAVANATTLAADNAGVASFQFYAELNTYAKWQPADITVAGVYTFTGIKTTDYTTAAADLVGVNQVVDDAIPDDVDMVAKAGATVNYTVVKADLENTGKTIYLPEKPASVTVMNSGNGFEFDDTRFTYEAETGILTVKTNMSYSHLILTITPDTGAAYTVVLTAAA